jgi:hypothetical protein
MKVFARKRVAMSAQIIRALHSDDLLLLLILLLALAFARQLIDRSVGHAYKLPHFPKHRLQQTNRTRHHPDRAPALAGFLQLP